MRATFFSENVLATIDSVSVGFLKCDPRFSSLLPVFELMIVISHPINLKPRS